MKSQHANPELYELTRAVPAKYIKQAPKGKYGTFVPHYVIEQFLLATVGHVDTAHIETLYGTVPKQGEHPELTDAVVGVVMSMTARVDGQYVTVTESGSCDAAGYEWNNGERMKKAMSDAYKRCAMRLGVGLHLWCKTPDEFFLPTFLKSDTSPSDETPVVGVEDDE